MSNFLFVYLLHQGDSGGPLMCQSSTDQWHLAGVVSWSVGCADRGKPDVFTNVQQFISWININANLSEKLFWLHLLETRFGNGKKF